MDCSQPERQKENTGGEYMKSWHIAMRQCQKRKATARSLEPVNCERNDAIHTAA
jgi:hypothetical protein